MEFICFSDAFYTATASEEVESCQSADCSSRKMCRRESVAAVIALEITRENYIASATLATVTSFS